MKVDKWNQYTIIITTLFIVVIIIMGVSIALAHEKMLKEKCSVLCQEHNMSLEGISKGRCVCSPNMNVVFYYDVK